MADVLQFPTKPVRDAAEIEQVIRDILLRQTGADTQAVDAIAARMRDFVLKFNRSFSVTVSDPSPDGLRDAVRTFEKQIQAFMNEIILDRAHLEIERHYLMASR